MGKTFANQLPLSVIKNAILDICIVLEEQELIFTSSPTCSEDNLWRELVSCILGSRVRFETACAAVERLDDMCLLCHSRRTSNFDQYETDILSTLSGKYPFYKLRANQIRQAAESLYGSGGSIKSLLDNTVDFREMRQYLISEIPGLGPKQSSLFLRNIGYADSVAVLDVHVLTYMNWVGLTTVLEKSIPTIRKYETLENSFVEHSLSLGYSPEQFDLAVWLVMKVARKEYKTWG
ncbi:hypothetical protein F4Z98_12335 [Candidatus Poribacteria bacterium]|nr:hypothetical protein [Candidatus Poribacteria bacterium]MYC40136.1 hypothetical protein [Candidatus Dadabacteria bacterium]